TNNWSGKNLEGPLWVTVFDGETGRSIVNTPFDPQSNEPSVDIFGDNYGNRSERYNACVAYLDGENPYIVFQRGYYGGREGSGPGRTVVATYSFENNQITKYWRFDTMDEGNEKYIGQGNHNVSVGDVDGDGKDEILFGALTLDHDGSVLWCSFMGHGDAMHLSDLDPFHYGLEFFVVHEHAVEGQRYGFTVFDAATGEVLRYREAGNDTGRGVAANIGPFGGTYVAWAGAGAGKINSLDENLDYGFNTMNFRIYWDGDLYEELLDGTAIFKIDDEGRQQVILDAGRDGSVSNNGSKSTPCLQADIFGDWREEVIWRSADNSVLRIYTTTTPTEFALPPLMTDHVYRMGIVWQNSSYNQPPHLGYYPAGIAELRVDSAAAKVNGLLRTLDAAPYIENGRTLVPLRFIAEALGAKVDYADGVVTVEIADRAVVMPIGSEEYTINGESRTMETAPVILSGRTMVPVRAVSEALGMVVDWNGETRTITVKRGDLPEMTYESTELPMIEAGQSAVQEIELPPVNLFIAGDSTGQSYRESAAPQAGWGQMIGLFLDDSVTVQNRAMAGRSLKSFFNEGRWESILNDAQAGDYVVIQFGHNDGDYSKEARYISHEDFAEMLENEYILPALAKGLNPIIATHTQPRWFNEETGTIWEPGDGVSYDSIQRDMAAKYDLPLIDVNTLSREMLNRVGMEESKKIHLYADPGQYEAHPNGVADNTHYSFYGAFEIAKLVAGGFENIPGLSPRLKSGYSQAASFEGDYSFDVRAYGDGFEEYQVAISAPAGAEVSVNNAVVITKNVNGSELVTRTAAQNGRINISASMPITAEITPVWSFAPEGGINAAEDYALDLPDGEYDFYFTKSDKERGNIFINSTMVGVNVDMYGTVGIPEGTVHTVKGFEVEGGAAVRVDQRTTRLKSVEAASTPTIFDRKTRIFVAGDSTVCNYYPIYPETVEAEILPGTVRTGWAQLLHRFVSDEYEVVNLAASGDWARNWKDNIFPTVLAEGQPGDIFIIQFGINDRNRDDQKKDTMKDALKYMIEESSKKGMLPILVKPQPSVGYTWGSAGENEAPNGNNGGFFNAVGEVADETGCAYVDLYALAGEHFAEVGRDYVSRNYQLWDYNADAMSDKLHISFAGARQICSLFSENASYQGLINTDGYYEDVIIMDGVHVLKNGDKTKLINLSGESRKVALVYADGEETLTLTPNEELSCVTPLEVGI
ncbi:MAG: hypothetical protein J1F63_07525, partial [Oscillospiraceae bacterium]|nr:hypothetical protein [Oscillospiraceae bacterium]